MDEIPDLRAWSAHCAKRAKETKGPEFAEPELTEVRRTWDRIIARRAALDALVAQAQEVGTYE